MVLRMRVVIQAALVGKEPQPALLDTPASPASFAHAHALPAPRRSPGP